MLLQLRLKVYLWPSGTGTLDGPSVVDWTVTPLISFRLILVTISSTARSLSPSGQPQRTNNSRTSSNVTTLETPTGALKSSCSTLQPSEVTPHPPPPLPPFLTPSQTLVFLGASSGSTPTTSSTSRSPTQSLFAPYKHPRSSECLNCRSNSIEEIFLRTVFH